MTNDISYCSLDSFTQKHEYIKINLFFKLSNNILNLYTDISLICFEFSLNGFSVAKENPRLRIFLGSIPT